MVPVRERSSATQPRTPSSVNGAPSSAAIHGERSQNTTKSSHASKDDRPATPQNFQASNMYGRWRASSDDRRENAGADA